MFSVEGKAAHAKHKIEITAFQLLFRRSAAENCWRVVLVHELLHGVEEPLAVALPPQHVRVVSGGVENIDEDIF